MKKFLIVLILIFIGWKLFLSPKQIHSAVPYKLIYREKLFGNPRTKELPMLIVLHGAGANEKDPIQYLDDNNFDIPVRVIAFRGPIRYSLGYRWAYGTGKTQEEAELAHDKMLRDVGLSIALSTDELTRRYPTTGKPFIFGFSEGATLAYYLGTNYPEKFAAIFAASGELSSLFIPNEKKTDLPPIHGYHGINDEVIPLGIAQGTISAIKRISDKVYFTQYDAGHTVPRSALDDIKNNIKMYVSY